MHPYEFCVKAQKWREIDVYEKNLVRFKIIDESSSNADAEIEDAAECEINIRGSQATQMQVYNLCDVLGLLSCVLALCGFMCRVQVAQYHMCVL